MEGRKKISVSRTRQLDEDLERIRETTGAEHYSVIVRMAVRRLRMEEDRRIKATSPAGE